ncbi:MAG: hypothetical protein ACJ8EY_06350, partial [Sphingomicrobium sp.]
MPLISLGELAPSLRCPTCHSPLTGEAGEARFQCTNESCRQAGKSFPTSRGLP